MKVVVLVADQKYVVASSLCLCRRHSPVWSPKRIRGVRPLRLDVPVLPIRQVSHEAHLDGLAWHSVSAVERLDGYGDCVSIQIRELLVVQSLEEAFEILVACQ